MNILIKGDAIRNTHPSVVTIRGDEAFDVNDEQVMLDQSLVDTEIQRLQAEYDNNQYQRDREYPSIGDQLDQLYWDKKNGTNTWEEGIDAVKAAHPKPE